jgi:hypothetical protein
MTITEPIVRNRGYIVVNAVVIWGFAVVCGVLAVARQSVFARVYFPLLAAIAVFVAIRLPRLCVYAEDDHLVLVGHVKKTCVRCAEIRDVEVRRVVLSPSLFLRMNDGRAKWVSSLGRWWTRRGAVAAQASVQDLVEAHRAAPRP